MRPPFVHDLDPLGLVFVEEQAELFADIFCRSLKEPTVDGNSAIFVDPPPDLFAEMVLKIRWCGTGQFDMLGEPVEGTLPGA